MSLTYVTAFLKIYKTDVVIGRTLANRLDYANPLLTSIVPLVIFVSPCYLEAVKAICKGRTGVIFHTVEMEELETYGLLKPFQEKIPAHRNHEKDTFEYITLMNAKAELVSRVAQENPFGTPQFAWADFCLFHIFQNTFVNQRKLELLCNATLKSEHSLVIPGCWDKQMTVSQNNIHWRFCGGFYMGTQAACIRFYDLHKAYLPIAFDGCTWEVNYWAFIEMRQSPMSWFKADHNDSMIDVPATMFSVAPESPVKWLTQSAIRSGAYPYPSLETYLPTSSSFLEFGGQQLLNVRYVNYTQTPQGAYIINDANGHLKTQNGILRLKGYEEMERALPMTAVVNYPTMCLNIQGLEDIRLYEFGQQIKFIATQRQWSPSQQNRMAIGTVVLDRGTYEDVQILEPPTPTGCEKNWIPLIRDGVEHFIYQWYPYQIGLVKEGKLEIVQTVEMPRAFHKVRGSTLFTEVEEGLLGVVHYSEERSPRHYYHMLVLLNKETFCPVARSQPFVFGRIGIEFCIGMAVRGADLQFWYSQHDRDPVWLVVPRTELSLHSI